MADKDRQPQATNLRFIAWSLGIIKTHHHSKLKLTKLLNMADLMTTLKTLDNSKLIDVVKNYKQYGYDEETRNSAISILEERGVSIQDLN